MGYLLGASQDLQASADLILGDIVFETILDLYSLGGDPSPTYSFLQYLLNYTKSDDIPEVVSKYTSFLESIPLSKKAGYELVKAYLTDNELTPKVNKEQKETKTEIKSLSTSSLSSTTAPAVKEKKESFLLIRGSAPPKQTPVSQTQD